MPQDTDSSRIKAVGDIVSAALTSEVVSRMDESIEVSVAKLIKATFKAFHEAEQGNYK